ncbi:alkanesulfonate monooxygenase SsuD/methylene tetrahydromethanopterin reductase-like flavin-dependent oxidoreductase (luciferase family) [Actinocorallia herbida]|uniref:Alkanesulfonate monooxygenase SsuD/methylene tetrahydromethanopterin reductase-like flavin-dependent oxidoreductase (Luciferase family) n=1 Tax=Actinocorallia herbida TaxID=58109 RepID=A0A3N1CWR5_9ACTN|nr:LLM class flavin-dependent oxidoreductase [Actinocorallia herbida]ROO85158.1 alkanesulfonate monooxygenase SsuD/methylene tetrahydromethanopterin reductase-like flavin-dependent oxidoreductase (luciferase family) [Actinocorallia herbida]
MTPEFHLYLPQLRLPVEDVVARARAAEDAGFTGIAFMDHLVPPLADGHDMWEAMTLAAWVLARTTTLTAGHLVLCDAFRHPAVLARETVTLDHASGGRFELGLGWGSVPAELETFGIGSTSARQRLTRLAESLTILRALWAGETVDHYGEHFTLVGARQRPLPTRSIPLTIGGTGPRTLDLVRAHADWWNIPVQHLDRLPALRDLRGPARISVQTMTALVPAERDRAEIAATARRRFGGTPMGDGLLLGTAPELADRFLALHAEGVDRFYLWFTDFAPPATLARCAELIDTVTSATR